MKKQNNKGFSLVELIIVIAIMAILVGVMAPQLMKYIERSRYSTDVQMIDLAYTALKTAIVDEEANEVAPVAGTPVNFEALLGDTDAFKEEVTEVFGASSYTFQSKAFEGESIKVTPNTNNGFKVEVTSNETEYDSVILGN